MAVRDLLNTLRGFGEGATLGAIKYPQAALYSQVMGVPYRESLAEIERQKRELAGSKAYQAANIVGSFAPALATGGGTLPATIAKNVGMGALSGFTANEGTEGALQDTLMGAGLGGLTGATGAGVAKLTDVARTTLSRNPQVVEAAAKQIVARKNAQVTQMLQDPKLAARYKKLEEAFAERGVADFEQRAINAAARTAARGQLPVAKQTAKTAKQYVKDSMDAEALMKKQLETGAWRAKGGVLLSDLGADLRALGPAALGGGVAGYGFGTTGLFGENVDPMQAALGGAIAGSGLSFLPQVGNLKLKAMKTGAALVPRRLVQTTTGMGTVTAVPTLVKQQAEAEGRGYDPYKQYLEQQPATEEDPYEQYLEK